MASILDEARAKLVEMNPVLIRYLAKRRGLFVGWGSKETVETNSLDTFIEDRVSAGLQFGLKPELTRDLFTMIVKWSGQKTAEDNSLKDLVSLDTHFLQTIAERNRWGTLLTEQKYEENRPIEDPVREADLLTKVVNLASDFGIEEEFIRPFYIVLMKGSKAAQEEAWIMLTATTKGRILTGVRPSGALHLGHYAGALRNWLTLEDDYECFFLIADYQVLNDHHSNPELIRQSVIEVVLDWLAVGLDPDKSSFVVQSYIPEHAELSQLLSSFTPKSWVDSNPTLRMEFENLPEATKTIGFYNYPVSQAADILLPKGELVPVGEDQNPHIELTRRIAKRFNTLYGVHGAVFPLPKGKVSDVPRLPGLRDPKKKMSKTDEGNAIFLKDDAEIVRRKVSVMYTDPNRVHGNEPGQVEGNTVFIYLDAFDPDKEVVDELKARYRAGNILDREVKERAVLVINQMLEPIRERRAYFEARPRMVIDAIEAGTERERTIARKTMEEVREAMRISRYASELSK